jgi:MoxR-like ATPase
MSQSAQAVIAPDATIVPRVEAATERVQKAKKAAGDVVFGQEQVIERTLITVLAGGHGLLIGVPGLAKTLLVETLGTVMGLDAKRIQFTPDLMPSDIIGSEVLEEVRGADGTAGRRQFRFIKGPIFGQLLMADEINRASPKTQSALLQAMQPAPATTCQPRSMCSQPRTRWSRKAPIRCPKHSSTGFCCRSISTIRIKAQSGACCLRPPAQAIAKLNRFSPLKN